MGLGFHVTGLERRLCCVISAHPEASRGVIFDETLVE